MIDDDDNNMFVVIDGVLQHLKKKNKSFIRVLSSSFPRNEDMRIFDKNR